MANKIVFVDNCSATAIEGKAVGIGKLYDLAQGKFSFNDTVVLLTGDQFVDTFQGWEYICHKVLVFDASLCPSTVELMPKSAHSFAHYGAVRSQHGTEYITNPIPVCGVRTSKKGNNIPDLDLVDSVTPFRFKLVNHGKDATGEELVTATVEHIQAARVVGFERFYVADYGSDGQVIIDDEGHCKFKTVRKPIFEKVILSDDIVKIVNDYLKKK